MIYFKSVKCAAIASNAESVAKHSQEEAAALELPFYFNIVVLVCAHLFFQLVLWYRGQNTVLRVVEAGALTSTVGCDKYWLAT